MTPDRVDAERAVLTAAHRVQLATQYAKLTGCIEAGQAAIYANAELTVALAARDDIVWLEFLDAATAVVELEKAGVA